MSRWLRVTILPIVFVASSAFAANLDLTPLHRGLRFNFGNPGARSLGMGGAFIGRADDASAAEANPAGLTVIQKPEVTIELRQLDFSQDVPFGVQGFPSAGVQRVSNTHATPSILFVVPAGNLAFAGYYTRPLDYQQQTSLDAPSGAVATIGASKIFFGDAPGNSSLRYRAEVFGLAGAWRIGGLSVGLGARYFRLKPAASFADFDVTVGAGGVPVKSSAQPTTFGRIEGSDSKVSYSVGLKWANPSENLSVGLVYKAGADYSVTECNPSTATERCSAANGASPSSFEIPTQIGAGISIRPMPGVTINGDIVRVQYDRLLRDFTPGAFCALGVCEQGSQLGFHIDNATEIHIGGEWAFPSAKVPFALRAGWWHDPSHSLEYRGATTSADPLVKLAQLYSAQSFPSESDQNHIAVGIGYFTSSFEINAAYDHSSRTKTASLSALKRF
jgi:long-subunit fatty acid transport protein